MHLFVQFGMFKRFVTCREGLIEANREGLTSSLGYLALHLAGVSWGSDLLFLASTPDHLFTSAGLLVVWSVSETRMQTTIAPLRAGLMWGALAYSSTLFPPASRRLANYNFFTWTLAYNLTLLAGHYPSKILFAQCFSLILCFRFCNS